jgi:predicted amidophosphoribosyltransferase
MRSRNETIVFDDFLRNFLRCCSVCGRPAPRLRQATWVCAKPETEASLTLALALCERCVTQPDWWARLDGQYRQRYGFDLDGRVEVRRHAGRAGG